ncbi:hypothetical protein PSTG_09238 [Puccinia striiformis f. sp. tritici PST-78]|uniref:Mediator of RNA polymerase II transcription subunit 7 n=1 Tax=Puccinia striiformis f. sp. tritici PST-78 TaxID=1165861 RepID=A0A0L0VE44_9BASI|nr:hypothetical protein PSTG_09238 [Puccinia striiformis f. sp. tritici PST-78]
MLLLSINNRSISNLLKPATTRTIQVRTRADLAPRKTKYRKAFKGSVPVRTGGSTLATTLEHGQFGLRVLEPCRISAKTLQSCETAIKRAIKTTKGAKCYLRVFPDLPVCVKGNEVRMGKGKGPFEYWACRAVVGRVLFEVGGGGIAKEIAYAALQHAKPRLPLLIDRLDEHHQPFDPLKQKQILNDQDQVPEDLDLRTLSIPPNLEWIKENGGWNSFGDLNPWDSRNQGESLLGMPKLYDPKIDRKQALKNLLNTLIYSYMNLLQVLSTKGPVTQSTTTTSTTTTETDQIVSHIELTAFNFLGLSNELRPAQATQTLKLMLVNQAHLKRQKAKDVILTCENLRNQLAALKSSHDYQDQNTSIIDPIRSDPGEDGGDHNGGTYDYELLNSYINNS